MTTKQVHYYPTQVATWAAKEKQWPSNRKYIDTPRILETLVLVAAPLCLTLRHE